MNLKNGFFIFSFSTVTNKIKKKVDALWIFSNYLLQWKCHPSLWRNESSLSMLLNIQMVWNLLLVLDTHKSILNVSQHKRFPFLFYLYTLSNFYLFQFSIWVFLFFETVFISLKSIDFRIIEVRTHQMIQIQGLLLFIKINWNFIFQFSSQPFGRTIFTIKYYNDGKNVVSIEVFTTILFLYFFFL